MKSWGLGGWELQLGVTTGEPHVVGAGGMPGGLPGGVAVGALVGVLEGVTGEAGGVPVSNPAVAVDFAVAGAVEHMGRVADCTPVTYNTFDFPNVCLL